MDGSVASPILVENMANPAKRRLQLVRYGAKSSTTVTEPLYQHVPRVSPAPELLPELEGYLPHPGQDALEHPLPGEGPGEAEHHSAPMPDQLGGNSEDLSSQSGHLSRSAFGLGPREPNPGRCEHGARTWTAMRRGWPLQANGCSHPIISQNSAGTWRVGPETASLLA